MGHFFMQQTFGGCKHPRACPCAPHRSLVIQDRWAWLADEKTERPQRQVACWRSQSWSEAEPDSYPGLMKSKSPGFSLAPELSVLRSQGRNAPYCLPGPARRKKGQKRRGGRTRSQDLILRNAEKESRLERDRQVVCPPGQWFSDTVLSVPRWCLVPTSRV